MGLIPAHRKHLEFLGKMVAALEEHFEYLEGAHQYALASDVDRLHQELLELVESTYEDLTEHGDNAEEGIDVELAFARAYDSWLHSKVQFTEQADLLLHLRAVLEDAGYRTAEMTDAMLLEDAELAYERRRDFIDARR